MSKDDYTTFRGAVTEVIPGAKFIVVLENGHKINAVVSGKIRKNNIHILLHDKVEVEISAYDLTVGRIIYRF